LRQPLHRLHCPIGENRRQQRTAEDHAKEPTKGKEEIPIGDQQQPAKDQQPNCADADPGQKRVGSLFDIAPFECSGRRHTGCFPGRDGSADQCSEDANRRAFEQREGWNFDLAHRDHKEEIVDRLRHQLHCATPEDHPQHKSKHGADDTQHASFEQNQSEDFTAGHAQGTQTAQHRSSLNHAKGDCVVDQKEPHHQCQQAQRGQVELKGGSHLIHRPTTSRRFDQPRRRRQPGFNFGYQILDFGWIGTLRTPHSAFRTDDQINPIQLPHLAQHFLRSGDVGDKQAVECASAQFVAGLQQANNGQRLRLAAIADDKWLPDCQLIAFCQRAADEHGVGLGHQRGEIVGSGRLRLVAGSDIAAEGAFGEGIDAEQAHGLGVEFAGNHPTFNHRRADTDAKLAAQTGVDRLIQPAGTTHNLVCCPPVTVSVPNAKARCAEPLARSMATIIATPIATPRIKKRLCKGRRNAPRQARRKIGFTVIFRVQDAAPDLPVASLRGRGLP
jgi:hypothetical protein